MAHYLMTGLILPCDEVRVGKVNHRKVYVAFGESIEMANAVSVFRNSGEKEWMKQCLK